MDLEKPAPEPDVRTGALDLRGMEPGATSFSIPTAPGARSRLDPDVCPGALDLRGMEPGATSFSIPTAPGARSRLDPDVRTSALVEHPRDAGERGRFPCRRVTKERSRIDPDVRIGAPG